MRPAQSTTDFDKNVKSTKAHYIGVDIGTASARACVINEDGELVAAATERTHTWRPQAGSFEQSTNDTWRSACEAVRSVMKQGNIQARSIRAIAFAATCSLAVFTSDTDEPVAVTGPEFKGTDHNVILWMDRRASEEAKTISATENELLKYLGGSISTLMELPKVLWLKNNMPNELFDRCKFFDLHDAMSHIAVGGKESACSSACDHEVKTLGLGVDGTVKGWSRDFLGSIGLQSLADDDFRQVGGVCQRGECFPVGIRLGPLCHKAAQDLGLPTSVIVGSGVIDSYAGWIGTVGTQIHSPESRFQFPLQSRLAAVAGTSTCHIVVSKELTFVSGVWGPYKDWVIPGFYMSQGGQTATGQLLQHIMETHSAYEEAQSLAKAGNLNIFDFLNAYLERMKTASSSPNISYLGRHVFFYGDHFGNRSPYGDPTMTGSVVGLTGERTLDDLAILYYCTMEFLALQTRQIISQMNNAGHQIESIFMSGSQCQNETLVTLIGTACNLPVVTPKYIHAAVSYGAALLAVKAGTMDQNGEGEDLWSTMKRLTKPGRLFEPVQDEHMKRLLDVKYTVFLELAERQRVFRNMVDEVPVPIETESKK